MANKYDKILGEYRENDLFVDSVNDTHIDWGTRDDQVSSSDMPDHNSHTVRDSFVHTINRGVTSTVTITLTGGLGVSWIAGELYCQSCASFFTVEAGSGTCTNNAVNYLKWVSGTTLTLSTVEASGNEILVAVGSVYDGNINGYREVSPMNETVANTRRGLRALFPTRVISGMSVHEDTDVTNPLDVIMDAGVLWKDAIEKKTPIEIKSRNTPMVRNFHTGGVWDSDTNIQIETTNYDNGTDLTPITANKYVKGLFIFMNGKIGFVYPREFFNTIAQAQDAALPTMPTGLAPIPKLTAIVYQQGAANFIGAVWQDVRAGISEESFSGVTIHNALANLAWSTSAHSGDVDTFAGFDGSGVATYYTEANYALLAGRSAGQTLIGGTTTTADLTLQTTSGVGTTGADMHFKVGNAGATEAMTILNNGNVGIGTDAPGTKLDMKQSADSKGLEIYGYDDVASNGIKIYVDSNGIARMDSVGTQWGLSYQGLTKLYIDSSGVRAQDSVPFLFGSNNDYAIGYTDASDSLQFVNGATLGSNIRMIINNVGNVGIGTDLPDTKLDVNGAITQRELSADPSDPDEGSAVLWMSDGTGTGSDGDILMKIQAGSVVKTITLVDFSVL